MASGLRLQEFSRGDYAAAVWQQQQQQDPGARNALPSSVGKPQAWVHSLGVTSSRAQEDAQLHNDVKVGGRPDSEARVTTATMLNAAFLPDVDGNWRRRRDDVTVKNDVKEMTADGLALPSFEECGEGEGYLDQKKEVRSHSWLSDDAHVNVNVNAVALQLQGSEGEQQGREAVRWRPNLRGEWVRAVFQHLAGVASRAM
eukprot:CAMPEP_0206574756 /NCGR_PEP_ID=MMETSP0325_2-20121206/29652_1 /ASSEMBLY_ACC=CAM_ASM_000347 /TAXON_ID=2866 /ORGANISM="Crypthecodinium cohnii, Strain Seligo" /LENGTH=199 /DNA_ID=CAMNT_0054079455 /DNA_START=262 /DNA_END=865 /DNA_ORIENTATION=-